MTNLYCKVRSSLASKKGQGLVEYGLILAGVAVVAFLAFTFFSTTFNDSLDSVFEGITSTLSGAAIG